MDRLEDLVRTSLRDRAQDVEPSPELWREVDRRIAARRRRRLLAWSLAAAAGAAAAMFVVPSLVGTLTTTPAPEILPADEAPPPPAGATVPTHAVVVRPVGVVSLLDLATGATDSLGSLDDVRVTDLAVRPTALPEHDDLGVVATVVGDEGPSVARFGPPGRGQFWSHGGDPAFLSSLAVAPHSDHLAVLTPADADGATFTVGLGALSPGTELGATESSELAVVEAGSRLLDWVGTPDASSDRSEIWLHRPDGTVVALRVVVDEAGRLVAGDTAPRFGGEPVLDAAASGRLGGPAYLLRTGADGPELVWSPDAGATDGATLPLADLLDVGDPEALWLDAASDAALVGDGSRALLMTHDGAGAFGPPVEVPGEVARAALLPATAGAPMPDAPNPVEDPAGDDQAGDGSVVDPVDDATPDEPVLLAGWGMLDLVGPDGRRRLVELPAEGESGIVDVAVRPGSTADDLTALLLTEAEGMYDLRHLRVVGGDVRVFEVVEPPYGPAGAPVDAFPADASLPSPVWAPDGTSYAWLDHTPNGVALRTAGWDDGPGTGDPATDQAAFRLDGAPDEGLRPQDWVALDGGDRFELRLVTTGDRGGLLTLTLERQADGALALPAGATLSVRPAREAATSVFAAAGGLGDGAIAWVYEMTGDGEQRLVHDPDGAASVPALPDGATFDDGVPLPRLRVTPSGAAVLTGPREAFLVRDDGEVTTLGPVLVAEPVR